MAVFQRKILKLWVILSVCLSFGNSGDSRRLQQFSLYSTSEQIENYTQNIPDLDTVSVIVRENRLQSVCSQMGVWAFFTGKNYTTVNSYGYHPATPGWTCSKRRIMADFHSPFRSIRHLGNRDVDTPSLSLYKEPFFASDELYFNGQELSFSSSQFDFGSFGFTGRDSWTLYAAPNFEGDSVCLQCKCDPAGVTIGVTYTAKLTLSASSLRRGCFGNQVLQPSGIVEKRVPSPLELNLQNKNLISLTLSRFDSPNVSLTFSGTELRLPCLTTYDTFQISGRSNWTVFAGQNFDGTSACLVYSPAPLGSRGARISRLHPGSQPQNFPAMTVASIKFGCQQNLVRNKSNPVPAFAASSKQEVTPATPSSITNKNLPRFKAQTTATPSSRDGRGRQLGPNYIPGDIDGYAGFEFVQSTRQPEQSITTSIPVIITSTPSPKSMPTPKTVPSVLLPLETTSDSLQQNSVMTTSLPVQPLQEVTTSTPPVSLSGVTTSTPLSLPGVTTVQPVELVPGTTTLQPSNSLPDLTTVRAIESLPAMTTLRSDESISSDTTLKPLERPQTLTTLPTVASLRSTTSLRPNPRELFPRVSTPRPILNVITLSPPLKITTLQPLPADTTLLKITTLQPLPADTTLLKITTLQPLPADTTLLKITTLQPLPADTTLRPIDLALEVTSSPHVTMSPSVIASSSVPTPTGVDHLEPVVSTSSVNENLLEPDRQPKISTTENLVEPDRQSKNLTTTPIPIITEKSFNEHAGNEVDSSSPILHAGGHEAATIGDTNSARKFFTAFLIVLGILVAAMIVTIGVFIYLRATRAAEADLE